MSVLPRLVLAGLAVTAAVAAPGPPDGPPLLLGSGYPIEIGISADAGLFHWLESLVGASQGKTIPAWHIQQVTATANGKTVLSAQWGPAISKNPFLSFKYKGAKGDKLQITWTDNKGEKRTDETVVA